MQSVVTTVVLRKVGDDSVRRLGTGANRRMIGCMGRVDERGINSIMYSEADRENPLVQLSNFGFGVVVGPRYITRISQYRLSCQRLLERPRLTSIFELF